MSALSNGGGNPYGLGLCFTQTVGSSSCKSQVALFLGLAGAENQCCPSL